MRKADLPFRDDSGEANSAPEAKLLGTPRTAGTRGRPKGKRSEGKAGSRGAGCSICLAARAPGARHRRGEVKHPTKRASSYRSVLVVAHCSSRRLEYNSYFGRGKLGCPSLECIPLFVDKAKKVISRMQSLQTMSEYELCDDLANADAAQVRADRSTKVVESKSLHRGTKGPSPPFRETHPGSSGRSQRLAYSISGG